MDPEPAGYEPAGDDVVRVGTFNIRTACSFGNGPGWLRRRRGLRSTISALHVDVLALQEVTTIQRSWVRRTLPDYTLSGSGRSLFRLGEASPVLTHRTFARVVDTTTSWFGPTPTQPGSRIPGATHPRIATTCSLLTGTGTRVDVTSLHIDQRSEQARLTSVQQLLGWLDMSVPQIVMGDFNATLGARSLLALLDGGFASAQSVDSPGTFHGFTGTTRAGAIDHILFTRHFRLVDATVGDGVSPMASPPSDHWPLSATLELVTQPK